MPLASALLGAYLLVVVYNGQTTALISEIKNSVGFLPWLISAFVLLKLYEDKDARPYIGPLIAIAVVAFALNSLPNLQSQFKAAWNAVGGK